MFDTSPTLYAPIAGDNGPALRALIEDGRRWIQINGAALRLETPVQLMDGGQPADYIFIEPAAGIDRVVVDVSGIGRNPNVPTDPSYSGFEYNGLHRPASYLAQAAAIGDRTITVGDGTPYDVGAWIYLSDESRNSNTFLLPLDGPMESRRVIAKQGAVLTLDRPLKRAHVVNVIAALHTPIQFPRFERLTFTGNAAGGIHLHSAHDARIANISSTEWRGRFMVLLDNGGQRNVLDGVVCTGKEPGAGPTQNAWGAAMEGQEDSRSYRSGGSLCGNGHFMNYCTDTIAQDVVAFSNNVNDAINWKSVRCVSLRPQTALAAVIETSISADSVDSQIIGRLVYLPPAAAGSNYLDPRTLPVDGLNATDRLLAFDENGAGKQVPKGRVVVMEGDGTFQAEAFEVMSPTDGGGSLRASNKLSSWLVGMLSAKGSKDWLLFDLKKGLTRLSVSATTGEIDVPGSMVVHGNLAMEATSGVYNGGNKVLGAQRPATADLAGSASLADVIAKVNLILADERAHGLRAA